MCIYRYTALGSSVNGTTGEGKSMNATERKAVVEEWIKVAAGRFVDKIIE